jgi:predicted Zn-dependent peptidase
MFAEMLGGTESSPLNVKLVKESGLFNAAESFCMRSLDDSIFMIYGLLNDNISHAEAEKELTAILQSHCQLNAFLEKNFEGVKNRIKAQLLFEQTNLMNNAQKLCYYELLNDIEQVNTEVKQYNQLELNEVLEYASATFRPENVSVLYYSPLK